MTSPSASPDSKPKRRFLQFSLRTLFVLMTLFAIWFGWKMNEAREQAKAVAWVQEMGGTVRYEYEFDEDGQFIEDAEPPCPKWLLDIIGIDFMSDVGRVDIKGTEDLTPLASFTELRGLVLTESLASDLTPLTGLKELRGLMLKVTHVSDLKPLAELKNLKRLYFHSTHACDLASLSRLKNLQELSLSQTPVTDLTPLAGLKSLEQLCLNYTPVADLTPLAELENLQGLEIDDTQVGDLNVLAEMKHLRWLFVQNTPVSKDQVDALQQALPNCDIVGFPQRGDVQSP
jgi:hypothetical protein